MIKNVNLLISIEERINQRLASSKQTNEKFVYKKINDEIAEAIDKRIAEASKETGIATSHIVSICKNKFKHCFGYSWCYVEDLGE